jgi:hypothetical protein
MLLALFTYFAFILFLVSLLIHINFVSKTETHHYQSDTQSEEQSEEQSDAHSDEQIDAQSDTQSEEQSEEQSDAHSDELSEEQSEEQMDSPLKEQLDDSSHDITGTPFGNFTYHEMRYNYDGEWCYLGTEQIHTSKKPQHKFNVGDKLFSSSSFDINDLKNFLKFLSSSEFGVRDHLLFLLPPTSQTNEYSSHLLLMHLRMLVITDVDDTLPNHVKLTVNSALYRDPFTLYATQDSIPITITKESTYYVTYSAGSDGLPIVDEIYTSIIPALPIKTYISGDSNELYTCNSFDLSITNYFGKTMSKVQMDKFKMASLSEPIETYQYTSQTMHGHFEKFGDFTHACYDKRYTTFHTVYIVPVKIESYVAISYFNNMFSFTKLREMKTLKFPNVAQSVIDQLYLLIESTDFSYLVRAQLIDMVQKKIE